MGHCAALSPPLHTHTNHIPKSRSSFVIETEYTHTHAHTRTHTHTHTHTNSGRSIGFSVVSPTPPHTHTFPSHSNSRTSRFLQKDSPTISLPLKSHITLLHLVFCVTPGCFNLPPHLQQSHPSFQARGARDPLPFNSLPRYVTLPPTPSLCGLRVTLDSNFSFEGLVPCHPRWEPAEPSFCIRPSSWRLRRSLANWTALLPC